MFKNFSKLSALLLLVVLLTTNAFSYPKRILMEDHTGAWCGWCVLGNQAMEDMLAEYQDKFIPIAVHNGDAMATGDAATFESETGQYFGLTGYPSGFQNRTAYTVDGETAVPIHPSYWPQTVAAHINDESIVNVIIKDWKLDKNAKTLTITVEAELSKDYNDQLAFNVFILEDSVSGTGTGWNQANYLSGNASYKTHPYYSLPKSITNYKHMNVLVDALGGSWGANGNFPATAKAGQKYSITFTKDLSTLTKIQNYDNLWFAAMVQEVNGKRTIMNAVAANKKLPPPLVRLTSVVSDLYESSQRSKTYTKEVSFKNESQYDVDVDFSLDAANSFFPEGWVVDITPKTANVKKGQEVKVKIDAQLNDKVTYASIVVNSLVKSTAEITGNANTIAINILTDGVDNVFYIMDQGYVPLYAALNNHQIYSKNTAYIPLTTEVVNAYPSEQFKLALFPEAFNSRGNLVTPGVGNSHFINIASQYLAAKKPIFISSIIDMFFVAGNYAQVMPNTNTMRFFKEKLYITGYTFSMPHTVYDQTKGYIAVNVSGKSGDDVTDGLNFSINQPTQQYPFYTNWVDQVKPLDANKVTPILNYTGTTMINGENNAAVKIITSENSRAIYTGFSLDLIANQTTRTTLLGNMITWLLGSTDVNEDLSNVNSAKISTYPNPAVNELKVQFENNKNASNALVYLTNMNGERVSTIHNGSINPGINEIKVSAETLASGTYFVVTLIDGIMSQQQVVIAK